MLEKKQVSAAELRQGLDKSQKARLDKILVGMIHLQELHNNMFHEMEQILKASLVYKFKPKSLMNQLRTEIGKLPTIDWGVFSTEEADGIVKDAEKVEFLIYQLFGLADGNSFLIDMEFRKGQIVWDAETQRPYRIEAMRMDVTLREKNHNEYEGWYEGRLWDTHKNKPKTDAIHKLNDKSLYRSREAMLQSLKTC